MISERQPTRSRGRPKGAAELQRIRLLQAAEALLASNQGDFSLRQVALRAEVTPPLAHYYFGSRDGLLLALVNERAAPRVDELLAAARERASQPVSALTRLMQRLTLLVASDGFMRSCLLMPAGEPLRMKLRAGLHQLLQDSQSSGQLRADLSPAYLADTLLGLCLFPFLDARSGEDLGERAAALTLQHVALLQDGVRPSARRS